MKWPLIFRRRHEDIVSTVSADRERIRSERDQAMTDAKTRHAVAQSAVERYTDLHDKWTDTTTVNTCLTDELAEVRKQLAAADTTDLLARCRAAERRANQLQARLDEAVRMPGFNPLYGPTIQSAENGVDA
ncbi:hypothetical protein [Streptomyces bauhiniae]|uniref:Uncharacterized protein n=1 Tax=Streptomyces bauhiniae TaxID=2340725 RepID=A0A7K3QR74_9ACTN|nr:hypothetical protein [Streptomyces bauhiniae]NEB92397.1 hypothetical protein [Streptomyces bauhiniae]